MEEVYDASSIKVLKGLEAVRKRPAMYIGDTAKRGFHHLFNEILDNSIDESIAGYAKNIKVRLYPDDFIEVEDDGRGIPTEMHEEGKSALEVVVSTLHAGGKFDKKVYKISGGLHGVGISVVCALSEKMTITVKRNGKVYQQTYSRGKVLSPVEIIGETKEQGTSVKFKPDLDIFSEKEFDSTVIEERMRELCFLNKGTRIFFENMKKNETKQFYAEDGLLDFVNYLCKDTKALHPTVHYHGESDGLRYEFAFTYTNSTSERFFSYVNNIKTEEGGTHVSGFRGAITRAINDFIRKNKLLPESRKIGGEDIGEGMIGIIAILHPEPQFQGQTKTKLGNNEVKGTIDSAVYSKIKEWFDINPGFAKAMCNRIISTMEAREAAAKAREGVRRKSLFESSLLPGKLADCSTHDLNKSEMYIVEGDSAGGSAKQARDREYQAILPLRGKILNVEKATIEKIFTSQTIKHVIMSIGTDVNENFNLSRLRYGKIIIMTDADVDGSHIRTLLLTLFFNHFRPLIEKGHIYIARPPLYKVSKGKSFAYVYSDEELNETLKKQGDSNVQRYKGLGEMNAEQLWETTMNPENRVLYKVTMEDAQKAAELFSILMGEDVSIRRAFIQGNATYVKDLDV